MELYNLLKMAVYFLVDPKSFATTRDYVISFPVTQKRYETLKKKVEDILK